MKSTYDVLVGPLLTEKGTLIKETENKVLFRVALDANKIEIKKAVEEVFKVKVANVRTSTVRGKQKRVGRHMGRTPDWKKAYITLKEGKINFLEDL